MQLPVTEFFRVKEAQSKAEDSSVLAAAEATTCSYSYTHTQADLAQGLDSYSRSM